MVDETFVEQIQVQGTQDAKKQLDDLGAAGEKAFNRISDAAGNMPAISKAASDAFDRIQRGAAGVGQAAKQMGSLADNTKATRDSLKQFLPQTTQTSTALQKLGGFLTSVVAGLKGHTAAAGEAASASKGAGREVADFGHELAILGRISGGQGGELTHLAHIVVGLGKAFAVVGPGLVALGLEKIAAIGAQAAGSLADLAGSLRLTVGATSALNSVGIATGVTGDKLAASLKGVNTLIKDTADKDAAAEAATRAFNQQLIDSRDNYTKTAKGLDDINTTSRNLAQSFAAGTIGIQDYMNGLDAIRKQTNNVRTELRKQDETERNLIREHQLAGIAAIQNGTALQKLGIGVLDANGKLKKAPAVLNEIADALKVMPAGLEKNEVEFDLIAAGLDRRLLPALRQGSAAFQQIEKDTAKIDPGFTDADVAIADKFQIAVTAVAAAWDGLINELGIGIAPAFTETLTVLKDLILQIKPGLVEFGAALANIVTPIVNGLATVISSIVIPALKGFFALLDLVASGINNAFGSQLTGMQLFLDVLTGITLAFFGTTGAVVTIVATVGILILKLKEMGASFSAIGDLASSVWAVVLQGATDLIAGLVDGFNGWVTFFTGIWTGIVGVADTVWASIKTGAQGAVDFVVGAWTGATSAIMTAFEEVKQFVLQVWDAIKQPVAAIFGGGGAGAQAVATIPGKAGGGPIRGPGTATSDSIPIWASDGEFMVRAAAVRKYGVKFMSMLNAGALSFGELGFALGGLITPSRPRTHFAEGGLISSAGHTLNLTIDGQQFNGLRANDATMDRLERFAVAASVSSAGRKPRWKR